MKEQKRARRRVVGLALGAGAAAAGMSLVPVSAAQAATPMTYTVTNNGDAGADTLRAAVAAANLNDGPDTIVFAPNVTRIVTASQIDITDSVSIVGPGAGALTIDGGGVDRIFSIDGTGEKATVISGLTLTNGSVENDGQGSYGTGGAITTYDGTVTLRDVTLTDNVATVDGGAVAAFNTNLVIAGSTFTDNTAGTSGGALRTSGAPTLTITDSTFTGNSAARGGGAVSNTAYATVVTGSTFTDNTAAERGGALAQYDGTLTISSSQLTGNDANIGGGAALSGYGEDTPVTITGSSIVDNTSTAQGGGLTIGSYGETTFPIDIVDSTISGNAAGDGVGSGVYAYRVVDSRDTRCRGSCTPPAGRITVTHSTIAANEGDGLTSQDGKVTLQGSIVADNTDDLVVAPPPPPRSSSSTRRVPGPVPFSLDYTLVEKPGDRTTADVTAGSNLLGVDPQLGALADNGGPTSTMLPAATSPVLDKAKAFGTTTDQRGLARPSDLPGTADAAGGDASDMGAVELQAPKLPTTPAATGSCDGAVATIVAKPGLPTFGTPGRDVILGTAGVDSISGGGGDDLICGLGGDDAVDAGAGRDRVFGGDGNDLIKGGADRDVLFGDAGEDRIFGGRANDTIDGGAGNDTVRANRGNDKVKGGGGKDYLRGGKNHDSLTGGKGKDKVRGGQAKDKVTKERGENQKS